MKAWHKMSKRVILLFFSTIGFLGWHNQVEGIRSQLKIHHEVNTLEADQLLRSKKKSKSKKEKCFKSSKNPKSSKVKIDKSFKNSKTIKESKSKGKGKGKSYSDKSYNSKGKGKGKGCETTESPVRIPTMAPQAISTKDPTKTPTKIPTVSPTSSQPTVSPTSSQPTVCFALTPEQRADEIRQTILDITDSSTLNDDNSPQSLALEWITNEDAAQICPDETNSLLQRYTLAVLYYSTGGNSWTKCNQNSDCNKGDSYLSSSNICVWFGSTCSTGFLTKVNLSETDLGLDGFIPDEIFRIDSIQEIKFDGPAKLQGSIPDALGEAKSLIGLDLDKNLLSGTIPSSIGNVNKLEVLDLDFNNLRGIIPKEISNLTSLRFLAIGSNSFDVQPVPEEFSKLTNLKYLSISNLRLNGPIPASYSQLFENMVAFDISANSITGTLDTVAEWPFVKTLTLNNNKFSGTIPVLKSTEYLTELRLQNNDLSGTLTQSVFTNMTYLEVLKLNSNKFSGPIPDLGNLQELNELELHDNDFTGEMPQGICELTGGDKKLKKLTADCSKVTCSCCTTCF